LKDEKGASAGKSPASLKKKKYEVTGGCFGREITGLATLALAASASVTLNEK